MGLLAINNIERVGDVISISFDENAHTRYLNINNEDIVVRGKANVSGRFTKCIPMGEFRNNSYRVKRTLLDEWGGLSVNDGWIQRSANPPVFIDPDKFLCWLDAQMQISGIKLIASNNI